MPILKVLIALNPVMFRYSSNPSTEIDINKRSFYYYTMRFAGSCSRRPLQRVLRTDNAMCGAIGFYVMYFAVHQLHCPSVRANRDRP